ncbi:MAG: ribonuclease R [Candidatus Taylorbacteria bacterium]|nr:ribonuclease R [Candidatus Taylorbacteria bacterium]
MPRQKKFLKEKTLATLTGEISVTGKGIGFFSHRDFERDVRIEEEYLNCALNGDTVRLRLLPTKRDSQHLGEVAAVLKRAKTEFVGVLEVERGSMYLRPDDKRFYTDLLIHPHQTAGGKNGYKALVRMHPWTDRKKNPTAEVVKIIGKKGEHETEIQSIILERGFAAEFPPAALEEARRIKRREEEEEEEERRLPPEKKRRRDFRGVPTFTIDPADAKDFDDSLSVRPLGENKVEVGVHIADVSHYVVEGTALDKEAERRGFSIYLVDRTVPMLPEILSNDLCSLNPRQDRLAFSAVFELKRDGEWKIERRWLGRTIIHSEKRFTYEEAEEVLDSKKGKLLNELELVREIADFLREERFRRGAVDFEQDEVRFELAEDGTPLRVFKKPRLQTHKLIEEWMLLANRSAANFMFHRRGGKEELYPFIYRIHDYPDPEKIAELNIFLKALGHELPLERRGVVTGRSLQKLFEDIKGKPFESLIKTAALRSMAKAAYSTLNIGHFGLAFEHYTHFTSPIRRYADLLVHRLMAKKLADQKIAREEFAAYERRAADASEKEIAVAEAERASIKYKQTEFMQARVGKIFEGMVSGITEWGLYIEEGETKAEGMVRLSSLTDDYYLLDEKNYCLVGERSKKKYSLGDKVRFRVKSADVDRKTIDYELINTTPIHK